METLYNLSTAVIIAVLLLLMLAANEIGYRYALRNLRLESDLSRTVSNALKASIFALVALLLAFSFSATSSRYDLRQHLMLDQANAVGTCYLRAGLLQEPARSEIRDILRRYVNLRLEHFQAGDQTQESHQLALDIERLLAELWARVETANGEDPEGVRNSNIIVAANEVIDLSSARSWAYRNHLPDPVVILLLGSVIIASVMLGHSSGQAGMRHLGLWFASNLLFALVLYVVLDFDRPRRGLIQIDQTPLIELRATLN